VINIISQEATRDTVSGPAKVYRNLIKGLDAIGYPYVVNRSLNSTKRLWVHDDPVALRYAASARACAVVGPNLYRLPRDIPPDTDLSGLLYIHPSEWAVEAWRTVGFDACDLGVWPVGIDLDEFRPGEESARSSDVLVYHKQRREDELERVLASLNTASLRHTVVRCGSYSEPEYVDALKRVGLVVWIGRHESQGIALQEALAMDVPVLLCDVTRLSEATGCDVWPAQLDDLTVTAAPYFDASCGARAHSLDEVGPLAVNMLLGRSDYAPRDYVQANLSLEGQARRFVDLWEHFGLTFEEGLGEPATSSRPWRYPPRVRLAYYVSRKRKVVRSRLANALHDANRQRDAGIG
jgi:hypothetical protein